MYILKLVLSRGWDRILIALISIGASIAVPLFTSLQAWVVAVPAVAVVGLVVWRLAMEAITIRQRQLKELVDELGELIQDFGARFFRRVSSASIFTLIEALDDIESKKSQVLSAWTRGYGTVVVTLGEWLSWCTNRLSEDARDKRYERCLSERFNEFWYIWHGY